MQKGREKHTNCNVINKIYKENKPNPMNDKMASPII